MKKRIKFPFGAGLIEVNVKILVFNGIEFRLTGNVAEPKLSFGPGYSLYL
jgi:hypothetical protein